MKPCHDLRALLREPVLEPPFRLAPAAQRRTVGSDSRRSQTLPRGLLYPIQSMIDALARDWGSDWPESGSAADLMAWDGLTGWFLRYTEDDPIVNSSRCERPSNPHRARTTESVPERPQRQAAHGPLTVTERRGQPMAATGVRVVP
jgi:hypothetical protein